MYHFFVTPDKICDGKVIITGSDVNHMKNVLRMKPQDEILVSDGQGQDYCCRIKSIDQESVVAEVVEKTFEGTELPAELYLFQGLPKGDKMELIIQKAVELGAKAVIPVATRRAVVKLDEKKAEKKIQRWQAIAEGAAKQSRRSMIPKVEKMMNWKEALAYAASFDLNLIPYENYKDMQETKQILQGVKEKRKIGIFIGPEGGFEEEEVDLAREQGVKPISLGKRILRTETAGLTILSVLGFLLE